MRFSLIMVTGGRTTEVGEFMESLAAQSFQDFELIIVQQNADDRLADILARFDGRFPLQVIRSLPRQINHSRNVGTAVAQGDILAFPDDDCLYPPDLLRQVDEIFCRPGKAAVDVVSGIAITPEGNLGSGRWHDRPGPMTLKTVWTSAIEFNLFIRRTLYEAVGGFDREMGLGTPYASGDAQDLILLAQRAGAVAVYDPSLRAIHPDKRLTPVAVERAFVYGAGLGYVLRKHRVPAGISLNFLLRPFGGALLNLLRRRRLAARYYWLTFRGRLSGLMHANPADPHKVTPRAAAPPAEQDAQHPPYRLVVGIATRGRAPILLEMLAQLEAQTRRPDAVIVCGSDQADIAGVADRFPDVRVLLSTPGLCRQRNMILDASGDADIVMFFDDDFFADPAYLATVEAHMAMHPATMVASGAVLADGINGPGLLPDDAHHILNQQTSAGSGINPMFSGYGCNMAIRVKTLRENGIRFDERLQLYCWQEDVDVSRRLSAFGDIVRLEGARGVHLGSKRGRSPGVKLGYSQVANPLYLAGKGTGYPLRVALTLISRNMAKNILRALWPESYVDRRGRLRGNLIALWHLLRGRMTPENVLHV